MSDLARWAALQDRAFATPLAGAVSRIVDEFGLSSQEASRLLVNGIGSGVISLQDADTGAEWFPSSRAMATQIDWATGYLSIGGVAIKMLVVHWPDVERAARLIAPAVTTDDNAVLRGPAPLRITNAAIPEATQPVRKGRPPKHDWHGADAMLAAWLCDDGLPERQSDLERRLLAWFPADKQPSESQVRERVKKAISARLAADACAGN